MSWGNSRIRKKACAPSSRNVRRNGRTASVKAQREQVLKTAIRISLSVARGVLFAGVGCFTAALIGTLVMRLTPAEDSGLGIGVLMACLLYALAFLFGLAGFVFCLRAFSKKAS